MDQHSDQDMMVHDPLMGALVDAMMAHPWRTRWHLSTDPDTPHNAQEWFIRHDPEPLVAVGAIMNSSVEPDVLELATGQVQDCFRLEALANNPRQTETGLATLSQSGFTDARAAVAMNPACPGWLANRLAVEDPDDRVRRAAAFHKDLTAATIHHLARDGQSAVRMAVCERTPKVPIWVLERLSGDRDVLVRKAANRTLGLT